MADSVQNHASIPECVICCTSLSNGELGAVVATSCGHCYHETCIYQAISYKKACPTCRAIVKDFSVRVIYLFQQTVQHAPSEDSQHNAVPDVSITEERTPPGHVASLSAMDRQTMMVRLLKANRSQARELVAARAKYDELATKLEVVNNQLIEHRRDVASLQNEKRVLEQKCEKIDADSRVQQFLHSIDDEIPPELCDAPQAITQYILSTKTLVQSTQEDLRHAMRRVRELEARNVSLTRKLNRYRERKLETNTARFSPLNEWVAGSIAGANITLPNSRVDQSNTGELIDDVLDVDNDNTRQAARKRARVETVVSNTGAVLTVSNVRSLPEPQVIVIDDDSPSHPRSRLTALRENAKENNEEPIYVHESTSLSESRGAPNEENSRCINSSFLNFQSIIPPCSRINSALPRIRKNGLSTSD